MKSLVFALAAVGFTAASISSASAEEAERYAQAGLNDYCITCWAEDVPRNSKRSCWAVRAGNQLAARIQGDLICLNNFGSVRYGFGRGHCKTKNYCKTIKR
ncbi:MAG: hypothetical protein AAGD23_01005 [Pseudomonadota bacterium]